MGGRVQNKRLVDKKSKFKIWDNFGKNTDILLQKAIESLLSPISNCQPITEICMENFQD